MTKEEIYEQVVMITTELYLTGFDKKICETAKRGRVKKVEKQILTFSRKNKELFVKINEFSEKYNRLFDDKTSIFGEGLYSVDTINGLSFFVFILLANIDEVEFFYRWPSREYYKWLDAIRDQGYKEIASCLEENLWKDDMESYSNIFELLVAIFKNNKIQT